MRANPQSIERAYFYKAPAAHTCCPVNQLFAAAADLESLIIKLILCNRYARFSYKLHLLVDLAVGHMYTFRAISAFFMCFIVHCFYSLRFQSYGGQFFYDSVILTTEWGCISKLTNASFPSAVRSAFSFTNSDFAISSCI